MIRDHAERGFYIGLAHGDVPALLAEIDALTKCDCGLPLSTGKCGICDNDE